MGRESTDIIPKTLMVKVFNFKENNKIPFLTKYRQNPVLKYPFRNLSVATYTTIKTNLTSNLTFILIWRSRIRRLICFHPSRV